VKKLFTGDIYCQGFGVAMKMTARKAVDPIIASLLLIAIAVAAGIIVYVYVNSLAGGLTQSGGQQVSEQISMDSYTFGTTGTNNLIINLRNTGSATVTIDSSALYYDGAAVTDNHNAGSEPSSTTCEALTTSYQVPVGTSCFLTITIASPTAGTSHIVKILTKDGGTSTFTVRAGSSG
jgi:archaellum component FlaF (FlaF/FlaG flagellin family)